jgi:two-component system, NtrC family, response regulator AtoC
MDRAPEEPSAPGPEATTELDRDDGAGPGLRFYLVVRRGEEARVLDVPEGEAVIIGRGEEATVRVDEAKVSRRHARIVRTEAGLSLEDLGSRNGTKVGSLVVRGAVRALQSGDVLQVGSVEVVVAGASAGPAPASPSETAFDDGTVVADEAMVEVLRLARRFARTAAPILLVGETGVGKEVFAERIHRWSPRAHGPLLRLNCAALPGTLLESELFGHEKGAFTGAERRKTGWLEAAHGGTLLLDETGDMPLATQVKLLRVLETGRLCRVGGVEEIAVDVRILCATHKDLGAEIAAGRFREDLFYRLNTFTLVIPPLRQRPTEVALLVELFARESAARLAGPVPRIDPDALLALQRYAWPGNVRELRNAVEHACVMADGGTIGLEHFPAAVRGGGREAEARRAGGGGVRGELEELERARIVEALAQHQQNQTRAAATLGMSRRALIYKMHKYGLLAAR